VQGALLERIDERVRLMYCAQVPRPIREACK